MIQCSRTHPCDNCTRRRKPEECCYSQDAAQTRSSKATEVAPVTLAPSLDYTIQTSRADSRKSSDAALQHDPSPQSLATVFGYHQGSDRNTIAILRRVGALIFPFTRRVFLSPSTDQVLAVLARESERDISERSCPTARQSIDTTRAFQDA